MLLGNFEKIEETGSGDTLFDYGKVMLFVIIPLCDRLCPVLFWISFEKLWAFEAIQRSVLIPSLNQFEEPYGNSSPMELLWMFMGYSKPYTVFTDVVELVAGGLLLFKRTTLLGSLMAMAMMLNFFVMMYR